MLLYTLKKLGFTKNDASFLPGDRIMREGNPYNSPKGGVFFRFPYPLVSKLCANGTVSIAHVDDAASLYAAHRNNKILLAVRDLRAVAVSLCRWMIRQGQFAMPDPKSGYFPTSSELSSSLLLDFFQKGDLPATLSVAKVYTRFLKEKFVHLVRFEDLVSPDREVMRQSAKVIAEVVEYPLEEVFQALDQTNGQKTPTYSGQLSELGDFWTQEVEDKFCELGGDVINEQLGYDRHYTPKS